MCKKTIKIFKFLEFFFNKNPIFLLYINMFADYSEKIFRRKNSFKYLLVYIPNWVFFFNN